MNRAVLLGVVSAGLMLAASCSQQGPTPPASGMGGRGGVTTGAGGASGSGGTQSSGGSESSGGNSGSNSGGTTSNGGSNSGGTTGKGGSNSGGATGGTALMGGASGSGGTTGKGGSNSGGATGGTALMGGASGSGGATGDGGAIGSGGASGSGGGSGSGGTTTKTGGAMGGAGTGGATRSGGAMGSGGVGTGGTTGSGGSSGTIDVNAIVPALDGYMWIGTCSDGSTSGLDCPLLDDTGACPNSASTDFNTQGVFRTVKHTVGGTSGTQYTVNFEVRGVLGTKCYTGGTMRTPKLSANPETNSDGWYVGGQPVASKWNTYEVRVSPAVAGSGAGNPLKSGEDIYFLNAFPYPPVSYGTDTYCEAHETFPMSYTASIKVMGGGTISLVLHDSNCLGQMNCGGPDNQKSCANPRTVDLTGMSPQPANFAQPYKQSNGFYPQWVLLDVKTVSSP